MYLFFTFTKLFLFLRYGQVHSAHCQAVIFGILKYAFAGGGGLVFVAVKVGVNLGMVYLDCKCVHQVAYYQYVAFFDIQCVPGCDQWL